MFGFNTAASEAASALSAHINNKTILITGPSPNSLGAIVALSLAAHNPKLLILAGRSVSKTHETASWIKSLYPSVKIRVLELDLSSLASVHAAVSHLEDVPVIDVLINNAGLMATSYEKTVDGFESQFAVNHLGHFLLTNLLLKSGKIPAKGGRVVSVSSLGHFYGAVRFEDIGFSDGKTYDKWEAYGQAKTANMLFAISLARRGVTAFSVHPGRVQTNLVRHMTAEDMTEKANIPDEIAGQKSALKTLEQGGATHVVAAFDLNIVEKSGAYLEDCVITKPLRSYAEDGELAERLWKLSEEMVGEVFEY